MALGKQVVHQFRYGSMQALHEWTEILARLQVSKCVVMVVNQGRHPWDETVPRRVMIEAIPEHGLCFLGSKGRESISTSCGDEVDRVVAIPVFEPMTPLIIDFAETMGT